MNLDDPKLTAFALGELHEPEKSAVAKAIASSAETRREVDEIRGLARALRSEFAAELSLEGRAPLADSPGKASPASHGYERGSLSDIHGDRWFWSIARPLAIAATLAVLGLVTAILSAGVT